MRTQTCSHSFPTLLKITGLVHVWGPAGAGKSLLAIAIAAEASLDSRVEWISTDGKSSFISHLKRNVQHRGSAANVFVTMTHNHNEVRQTILDLVTSLEGMSALIVVDPLTRVVDMARSEPVMWGQELIEEALPTLAALAAGGSIVLVTSECRSLEEGEKTPVHHKTIRRWADNEILVQREKASMYSTITSIDPKSGAQKEVGRLRLLETGLIEISICQPGSETRRST